MYMLVISLWSVKIVKIIKDLNSELPFTICKTCSDSVVVGTSGS